ncbi:MAG: NAD(P)H-dependent oxidoreductase [Bacteroidota bacterium]|nr:NAD(P)H-dependent oxidoreductase [Bacteroidota bacterium]
MKNILIISSSIRTGRKSPRVSTFFKNFIEDKKLGQAEILDLAELQLPVFNERLRYQENPTEEMLMLHDKIESADGIIIVTPEYNGGYPASIKNVIDLLGDEWYHKPIAISTVSSGAFGGSQVIMSLQFTLWKLHALIAPAMFPVPKVEDAFDESGHPKDKEGTEKRAAYFLKELIWLMDANAKMKG